MRFTWVARSGNRLAHTLALLASRDSLPSNWRWHPPAVIKDILIQESYRAVSQIDEALRNDVPNRPLIERRADLTCPVLIDSVSMSRWASASIDLCRFPP